MTVREAAKVLEISESLVYKLCAAGRLGHRRIGLGCVGGVIRIDPEHIAAFNRACAVEVVPPDDDPGRSARGSRPEIPDLIGQWRAEGDRPMTPASLLIVFLALPAEPIPEWGGDFSCEVYFGLLGVLPRAVAGHHPIPPADTCCAGSGPVAFLPRC